MLLEGGDRFFVIILAAHGEDDAPLLEGGDVLLKSLESLSARGCIPDLDTLQSIFRDDATPESVIQVQDEDLLGSTVEAVSDLSYLTGDMGQKIGGAGLLALEPRALVPGHHPAMAKAEELDIANVKIWGRGEAELEVYGFAETPVRAKCAGPVSAEVVSRGQGEICHDNLGASLLMKLMREVEQ
jgi:hypothetical protein